MAWEMFNSSYLDIHHWQHNSLPFVVLAPDLGPSVLLSVLLVVHGLMFRLPEPGPVPAGGDPMQHVQDSLEHRPELVLGSNFGLQSLRSAQCQSPVAPCGLFTFCALGVTAHARAVSPFCA